MGSIIHKLFRALFKVKLYGLVIDIDCYEKMINEERCSYNIFRDILIFLLLTKLNKESFTMNLTCIRSFETALQKLRGIQSPILRP